jgi:hypothetical protein
MPETIHCHVRGCGQAIHGENFADIMSKLRHHRKAKHPQLFKKSVKKSVETRKENKRSK